MLGPWSDFEQVGITLVGAISAAVGRADAEETLSPILQQKFGLTEETAEAAAIALDEEDSPQNLLSTNSKIRTLNLGNKKN